MQAEGVKKVFSLLGKHNLTQQGKWMMGSCPFAHWKHGNGKDSNPSFGITVEKGTSHYSCFSCSSHGRLDELPVELMAYMTQDNTPQYKLKELFQFLEDSKVVGYTPPEPYEVVVPKKKLQPFDEKWLATFISARQSPMAMKYLASRGVPDWQIEYFDLRFDTQRRMIGFPLRTKDGVLAGMRGRAVDADALVRFHDYSYGELSNISLVLFNENHLDYSKPIILVEGNFDVLAVGRHYPNVVSAQTVKLTPQQRNRLVYAPEVYVMFDNDKAGSEAFLELKKYIGKETVLERLVFDAEYKDAGAMPDEALREALKIYVDI